ncbi:MAG TPA: hypothetical protein VD837_08020 [Terriglobales bacterium]|nr:hypothetical protein [Terriglobales bacterium]
MRTKSNLLAVAVAVLFSCSLFAQDKGNKFNVVVSGKQLGTEEYSITRDAKGYKLKSKATSRHDDGRSTVVEQEQLLEPDMTLKRYTLRAVNIDGIQTIEAARDKDKIRMSVRLPNREPRSFSVPLAARIVVLDNMVVSHMQVLLDLMGGKPPAPDYGFLVPQQLTLLPGGVTQLPRQETASLDGRPLNVRKYSVNAGGLIIECWADSTSSRLMRVWVPTQRVEFIREGYRPAGAPPSS